MLLLKNFAYLAGAEAITKSVTFVAIAYLARIGGPVGFGNVEFAVAAILCAGLIVDQGLGPYGAREIARSPEHTEALVAEIVQLRVLLAMGSYAGVITFALLSHQPPMVIRLLLVSGVSLLGMPFLLQWVF